MLGQVYGGAVDGQDKALLSCCTSWDITFLCISESVCSLKVPRANLVTEGIRYLLDLALAWASKAAHCSALFVW
uniref:Uncharacterized protein n=1 Tax=Anguilla anguilla TaxID=7936 RepID=A0A0E9U6D8_ANGAN